MTSTARSQRKVPNLKAERHARKIDRYLSEYRAYLMAWTLYTAGEATPGQVRRQLDRYLKAYREYLRSEALVFAVAVGFGECDAGRLKEIRETLDRHIDATRKTLEELPLLFTGRSPQVAA